jgi:CheY-like chemotaxis protein
MESVHASANSLLDLINDILDFSKIEAGKLELSTEKTDLWELSAQIVDVVKFKTAEKGIELLLHLSNNLPRYAWIDGIRIRQVLINLLGNAVKFTESGEIELSLEVKPGFEQNEETVIEFSVRDTGKGISPENRRKIFEAFSQEDGSTTRKYGGTGLGLTISNKLLSLMDSQLELESEIGKGSRFYFVLNLKTESGSLNNFEGLEKLRHVLIIDDNSNNSRILQQMLSLKSITSDIAANGIEALGKITGSNKYDVVITDFHMPFMDGIEVIRQIRYKLHLSAEVLPIILLHSSPDDTFINEACREFRVEAQVNKPITINRLFELLARIKTTEKPVMESGKQENQEGNYSPGIKILVADDNEFNMLLSKSMLKSFMPEADVIEAHDGKQAVALYGERKPDLVLMDVQMPEMSGYEASLEIRKSDNGIHVPIIALTAGTVKGERERCMEAGMDDYLSKPVLIETLKETMKKWLPVLESRPSGEPELKSNELRNLQHFNRSELLIRLGGQEKTIKEILKLVRDGAPSRLVKNLAEAIEKPANLEQVRSLAHSIKGAGNSACFEILADYASELERLEPFELEKAHDLITLLVDEVAFLEKSING